MLQLLRQWALGCIIFIQGSRWWCQVSLLIIMINICTFGRFLAAVQLLEILTLLFCVLKPIFFFPYRMNKLKAVHGTMM